VSASLSLTQSQEFRALRAFLLGVLPTGVEVVLGQVNKVAEPKAVDFVVMWPLRRPRLATNIDGYVDTRFTGFVSGQVLTVTAVDYGVISLGIQIFGVGLAPGTVVTQLGTGTGSTGTYTVNNAQTVAPRVMACGTANLLAETQLVVQLDVHGPGSADNAQIITTAFRDDYAVEQFSAMYEDNGWDVWPLYAEDKGQLPFINESDQYEDRWVIEVNLQVNPVVMIPLQFFEAVEVGLIEADIYPGPKPPPGPGGQLDFSKPGNSDLLNTGMV
jgi:hypothetical protein